MEIKVLKILIFATIILIVSSLKVSMRSNRNNFLNCNDEKNCNECTKNNNYKKCKNNVCYCCDLLQNKCVSQEKNTFF